MSQILRGNFTTRNSVTPEVQAPTLEQQFEREALKRLGGSIAFVSKKKLLWTGDAEPPRQDASSGTPDGIAKDDAER
jgi:hypothetical protein